MKRWKALAQMIMDADLPKRQQAEIDRLRNMVGTTPRWIADMATKELFERQPDNSYRLAYRMVPIQEV